MAKTATATKPETGITVEMKLDRSTKGTHVYKAEGDVAITSLYVQKTHMETPPEAITVFIK
jgi:hypothetical protein